MSDKLPLKLEGKPVSAGETLEKNDFNRAPESE
jgi:hypothetical protein